ncbi:hypothetical protein K523DRAFT_368272 [Schizophyllum commune Tattone D]|nr:hypothetical protein K523DRAFT_368272 [Schizophyllum commune Tattone D]
MSPSLLSLADEPPRSPSPPPTPAPRPSRRASASATRKTGGTKRSAATQTSPPPPSASNNKRAKLDKRALRAQASINYILTQDPLVSELAYTTPARASDVRASIARSNPDEPPFTGPELPVEQQRLVCRVCSVEVRPEDELNLLGSWAKHKKTCKEKNKGRAQEIQREAEKKKAGEQRKRTEDMKREAAERTEREKRRVPMGARNERVNEWVKKVAAEGVELERDRMVAADAMALLSGVGGPSGSKIDDQEAVSAAAGAPSKIKKEDTEPSIPASPLDLTASDQNESLMDAMEVDQAYEADGEKDTQADETDAESSEEKWEAQRIPVTGWRYGPYYDSGEEEDAPTELEDEEGEGKRKRRGRG